MACFVSCSNADQPVVQTNRDRVYMCLLKVLTDATDEQMMKTAYQSLSMVGYSG